MSERRIGRSKRGAGRGRRRGRSAETRRDLWGRARKRPFFSTIQEGLFPAGPQQASDAGCYTAEGKTWASPWAHAASLRSARARNHCKLAKAKKKDPGKARAELVQQPKEPLDAVKTNVNNNPACFPDQARKALFQQGSKPLGKSPRSFKPAEPAEEQVSPHEKTNRLG
jgi:hypothetical protein